MSNPAGIPELDRQPLAVDYIDNHAPRLHPAFAQRGSKYDPALGRYVLTAPSLTAAADEPKMQPPPPPSLTREASSVSQTTVATEDDVTTAESMRFWDEVFPEAMERLKAKSAEPEGREAAGCSIRGLTDWRQVYQVLERCHQLYIDDSSWTKKFKKGFRSFSDHGAVPMQNAWQMIPDVSYISPVRGTIDILFDVR